MKSMNLKKWMLAVALVAGGLGLGATSANAAQVGVYVNGAAPGPGYVWVNGYWANGYWVPGYWSYGRGPGVGFGFRVGPGYYHHHRW
jgi:WXXGXW repeat (2 copies)